MKADAPVHGARIRAMLRHREEEDEDEYEYEDDSSDESCALRLNLRDLFQIFVGQTFPKFEGWNDDTYAAVLHMMAGRGPEIT
jgi:hypothetical protein